MNGKRRTNHRTASQVTDNGGHNGEAPSGGQLQPDLRRPSIRPFRRKSRPCALSPQVDELRQIFREGRRGFAGSTPRFAARA